MDFVIHRRLIGSKKHRKSNGEWIEEFQESSFVVGHPELEKDLLTALYLSGTKIVIEPPKFHQKVFRNFTLREDIPWELALPRNLFETWVQDIVDKVSKALKGSDLAYYENIFKASCKVVSSLGRMKIHKKKWNFIMDHDIQGVNQSVIESFEPDKKGFAEPIKYNLLGTISGRAKVVSGPEILRLNKELKTLIKSRYKGGKVVQFDYVSLEPRLALILCGHKVPEDIYSYINETVFGGEFSREVVKLSTLSVMYGAGSQSLSEKTGLPISVCKQTIKQLKEFFDIYNITKKLSKEFQDKKIIRNHFGRAIYPEDGAGHKLYNNIIQSTAVDAAILGFFNIINALKDTDAIPVFVIHDNIGIDMPPEMLSTEWIQKIKSVGGEIPGLSDKLLLDSDTI